MTRTYAIADLHGRFDLLEMAYAAIISQASEPGTIVHLGDYIDRGPRSREIIEFLIDERTIPGGWNRVVLKGNHEDIMLQACTHQHLMDWWVRNGGGATLISYGHPVNGVADGAFVPQEHLRWAFGLPRYLEDELRVYVHAGCIDGIPLDQQTDETLLWMLYPDWDVGRFEGKHVVHGHHQFARGPICMSGRTDLDTFAWYTGRLVVGVFDDARPGGPIDLIEVKGPSIEEVRANA